jgi:hypothetical protein
MILREAVNSLGPIRSGPIFLNNIPRWKASLRQKSLEFEHGIYLSGLVFIYLRYNDSSLCMNTLLTVIPEIRFPLTKVLILHKTKAHNQSIV